MSSAQEMVLKALTASILFDAYLRIQDKLVPPLLSWLMALISHN